MTGDDGTDDGVRFTRRSLLTGLGAVGVASTGAGLGTTALFSDEESMSISSLEAGAMNMRVTVDNIYHSSTTVRDNTTVTPKDAADGNEVTITCTDLKPGDWLILEWNPEVIEGPGYVQFRSIDADYASSEGLNPESESDTAPPGDLGDAMLWTFWDSYNNLSDSRQYLEGLDGRTDNADSGLDSWEQPDTDGLTASGAEYTTVSEAHDVCRNGLVLRDDAGDPLEVGTQGNGASLFQLLELPLGVGNDIQGDELTFTIRCEAEQTRNNGTPFGGT